MKIRSLAIASLFVLSTASLLAVTLTENFSNNPLAHGWKNFGNTNLFHWNSTNENMEVTWDSTNQNSYFALPLGTVLAKDDNFSVSFDLKLNDAVIWNYGNQIAVGLLNWAQATNSNFSRANGYAPSVCEFDYFLDSGYGDSIDATLIDTNGDFSHLFFAYDNQTLVAGTIYQITLNHTAGSTNLSGAVYTNGVLISALPFSFPANITDFRLDTLSINCYQDDGYGDSLLAHGTVDNFSVTLPPPPVQNLVGNFSGGQWQTQFQSRSNWLYSLEHSTDLKNWDTVTTGISSNTNAANLILVDTHSPVDKGFYRIRADRP